MAADAGSRASQAERYILVYDLGGGTFDATLVRPYTELSGEQLRLEHLALHCNRMLGGKDWDSALAELIAEKVVAAHGVNPLEDLKSRSHILTHAEKAKRSLTKVQSVQVVGDLQSHMVEVTRDEFAAATEGLLFKTRALVEMVIADAAAKHGIDKSRIDILLAGGSTWMPQVSEMLTEVMEGRPPLLFKNRQQLVSMGAAYVAHFFGADASPVSAHGDSAGVSIQPADIPNVTAYGVGVEVSSRTPEAGKPADYVVTIIPRGSRYGDKNDLTVNTMHADARAVAIKLYECSSEQPNERREIEDSRFLMECKVTGLPGGRPAGRPIDIALTFDSNGIIHGRATDRETSSSVEIVYDRSGAGITANL